jgi:two-component system, chemotaxis family, chemotaxis protein CheY
MNGLEFIRTLRAEEATKTIPVIMVTTNSSRDEVTAAIKLGITDYVVSRSRPKR